MLTSKLSIGIPTFNQGEYLEKTILSALNQTVKPYEIVVSNNHCNDALTDDILNKYKNKIKIIKPSTHLPMMENWNFLCKNLTGDFISLISSDDYYESNFVEEFYKNINKDGVLYRFGYNLIDSNDTFISEKKIRSVKKKQTFPGNFYEQLLGPKTTFAAFVIKSETMKEVGFFDENLKLVGDWGLWLRLSPMGTFYYIDKIVSNYRIDYRPILNKNRFNQYMSDLHYIYDNIQKELIDRYHLREYMYKNAIKLHIYKFEKFMLENGINNSIPFEKFKELLQGKYIKNDFEFKVYNFLQHFYEGIVKG